MANILLIWEQGGSLGHLMPMRALAAALVDAGHRVTAAVRHVAIAAECFGDLPAVRLLPAPLPRQLPAPRHRPARCYAHILHNLAMGDAELMTWLSRCWRDMFAVIQPDVAIFDASPTALLATRGVSCRRVEVGVSFACPPPRSPLPRFTEEADPSEVQRLEAQLLDAANVVMRRLGAPPLQHMGELYGQSDGRWLLTVPELDVFGARSDVLYGGPWSDGAGKPPTWPDGDRPRIFAYLKPFKALPALLEAIRRQGVSTLVYGPALEARQRRRFGGSTMRFETEPLNIARVAESCDMAILNGGNATTAQMLLAGRPIVQIPIVVEQILNARRTVALGAGRMIRPHDAAAAQSALPEMLVEETCRRNAQRFADAHRDFDPARRLREAVESIGALAD